MAISLASLKPVGARPVITTIVGEGGVGKTTLASLWPDPVFIPVEDGLISIAHRQDMAAFPQANSSQDVLDAIAALGQEEHNFRTLVIDSVTQLNHIIEQEILASDSKAKSIATALGGYGAGYAAVADRHAQIRAACGWLMGEKAMHIVFIAHADVETIDPPDDNPFMRYTLRMHKKSVSHYTDNVDIVAYLKLKKFVRSDKKVTEVTGERIITCYPTPNHVSKNRFGISEDLPFDGQTNPFAPYLNFQPVHKED